jgi:hypothetical protein
MRVDQSMTLHLQGDDVACLRSLLRGLPAHMLQQPGVPVTPLAFVPGEQCIDPTQQAMFVQRLMRAVQGAG